MIGVGLSWEGLPGEGMTREVLIGKGLVGKRYTIDVAVTELFTLLPLDLSSLDPLSEILQLLHITLGAAQSLSCLPQQAFDSYSRF
jgi:hypothetical protein